MSDLDLDRLDKGELRCLVQALAAASGCLTPRLLAHVRWTAAAERYDRLRAVEQEAMRAYLIAHEHERDATREGRLASRLTKTRMDAELAWGRTKRARDDAYAHGERRWKELQALWEELKGPVVADEEAAG